MMSLVNLIAQYFRVVGRETETFYHLYSVRDRTVASLSELFECGLCFENRLAHLDHLSAGERSQPVLAV